MSGRQPDPSLPFVVDERQKRLSNQGIVPDNAVIRHVAKRHEELIRCESDKERRVEPIISVGGKRLIAYHTLRLAV